MSAFTLYLRGGLSCLVAASFCGYQFMLQGAPAVMVPELVQDLDLNLTDVGWLSSSFLYVYLLLQLPGGYLADRLSSKGLLIFSSLLIAAACYGFSHASTMTEACLTRGMMGIATAPGIIICLNLIHRWFPARWFFAINGLAETVIMVGGALGPLVIPRLMIAFDWRQTMVWLAAFGVLLAVASLLLVRSFPPREHLSEDIGIVDPTKNRRPFSAIEYGLYCVYGFGAFAMVCCFGGLWGVPFLSLQFPDQDIAVASTVALIFIGLGCGVPMLGALSSWLNAPRRLMVGSVLASLLFTCLLLFCNRSLQSAAVLCFLSGFFSGGYMLVFGMVRIIGLPAYTGLVLAGANGCMLMPGPALQPAIGWILDNRVEATLRQPELLDFQLAFLPMLSAQLLALLAILILSYGYFREQRNKTRVSISIAR
ncbi:MFS transporter [Endozoicomonadaceae bacterium StTr2]